MEKILNFIHEFIEADYQANVSYLKERDIEKHTEKVQKHIEYFSGKMLNPPDFSRDDEDDEWFEERKELEIYKRILFQVKEHDHDSYGKIYRCYLSNPSYQSKKYYESVFVTEIKGEYKIFSIYQVEPGIDKLAISLNDWEKSAGEKIEQLGKLTNVLKITPPVDNEVHMVEYKRN